MIIQPIKYVYHGDHTTCEALKGHANRAMIILENMMNLGGLDQHVIKFTPYNGSLIVARKFFGVRVVDIYTDVPTQEQTKPQQKMCICNCNFSVGWIFDINEGDGINGAVLYTVMACNTNGEHYKKYENILSSDWTEYDIGDCVVMIPYNQMAYLCCTDKTGGENEIRGCSPLENIESISSDEWRTTYRIIPICQINIPLKIEKGRINTNG